MKLSSIEEFASGTGHSLRGVIKDSFMRLPREFKNTKLRKIILKRQNGICPLCEKELQGTGTHVDHIWTTCEATDSVIDGAVDLVSAYNRLWAEENMRVVHSGCNIARNRVTPGTGPAPR